MVPAPPLEPKDTSFVGYEQPAGAPLANSLLRVRHPKSVPMLADRRCNWMAPAGMRSPTQRSTMSSTFRLVRTWTSAAARPSSATAHATQRHPRRATCRTRFACTSSRSSGSLAGQTLLLTLRVRLLAWWLRPGTCQERHHHSRCCCCCCCCCCQRVRACGASKAVEPLTMQGPHFSRPSRCGTFPDGLPEVSSFQHFHRGDVHLCTCLVPLWPSLAPALLRALLPTSLWTAAANAAVPAAAAVAAPLSSPLSSVPLPCSAAARLRARCQIPEPHDQPPASLTPTPPPAVPQICARTRAQA